MIDHIKRIVCLSLRAKKQKRTQVFNTWIRIGPSGET